ncbi:hypothetical protein ACFTUC_34965 [Streptomyces sp. NPDC056944]|uniref:hypothetical protein n=1 Tax=Streptomyces sp. NPDC056944 TaxID=3345972 RepID=UPI003630B08B
MATRKRSEAQPPPPAAPRDVRAVFWGMGPIIVVALVAGAFLWGTGYDLVSATALTGSRSDVRQAAAWLAVVSLLLFATYPCLRLVIGLLRGMWWPGLIARWSRGRQYWHRRVASSRRGAPWPTELAHETTDRVIERLQAKGIDASSQAFRFSQGFIQVFESYPLASLAVNDELRRAVAQDALGTVAKELTESVSDADRRIAVSLREDKDLLWAVDDVLMARSPVIGANSLRYPLANSNLQPTALGNAEAAIADRVHRRYRLYLGLAWPRMTVLLTGAEQQPLADAGRKADAATSLAAGWLLATVGLLLTAAAAPGWPVPSGTLLVAAVGTATFYLASYRQAIDRTIAYGQLVEATVDLQRLPLLDALGWRRPHDPEDERAVFAALSVALAGGPVDERFRCYSELGAGRTESAGLSAALTEVIDGLPDRLHDSVDRSVSEAVRQSVGRDLPEMTRSVISSVERGLDEKLEPALQRTLHQSLAGPKLDNFDGHLAVTLLDGESPVPIDDSLQATVLRNRQYELAVTLGYWPDSGAATVPVRVRGGNSSPTVEFAVSVDSNIPALRKDGVMVVVPPEGESHTRFAVTLDDTATNSAWLWVRVSQHGRTIQNLEITLMAARQSS